MTLHIDLPPDLESELLVAAVQQGVSASDYALSVLKTALTIKPSRTRAVRDAAGSRPDSGPADQEPFYSRASRAEWEQAFQAWVHSHHDVQAPALSAEALRRENMYDDRGA
jgi:hypothetical protein